MVGVFSSRYDIPDTIVQCPAFIPPPDYLFAWPGFEFYYANFSLGRDLDFIYASGRGCSTEERIGIIIDILNMCALRALSSYESPKKNEWDDLDLKTCEMVKKNRMLRWTFAFDMFESDHDIIEPGWGQS